MNLRMDLIKKKDELRAERAALEKTKQEAHEGINTINKTLRRLDGLIAEAYELLGEDHGETMSIRITGIAVNGNDTPVTMDSEINQAINER